MLVVNKSTVPVGTARWLQELITERLRLLSAESSLLPGSREDSFSISSAPEFLREGKAVYDTLFPDRLIFGVSCEDDARRLQTLYAPIIARRFPRDDLEHQSAERPPHVMVTTVMTAELIKYAGNAFLATKLSFINELAPLCASVGVSVVDIADGIGLDHRIGREFLNAGIGWGGSCLGKDTQGLRNMAIEYGLDTPLLAAVMAVNERQRDAVMGLLQQELLVLKGSRIALLGLAFKPGTDDLRDAPSLDIARKLLRVGATVSGYDPAVKHVPVPQLRLATSVLEMSEGADALVLVTEWSEFQDLPWSQIASRMRKPVMIDGRNLLSPRLLSDSGFSYRGIGR
jgi:UDPglucose 6-dehydrogenase